MSIKSTPQEVAMPTFQFENKNKWLELINLGYN